MSVELTEDQLAFLEKCNLEFSERYTDSDLEYKKVYDAGIPPPPIVYPWWGHTRGRRFNGDRPGGSRYNDGYRERNNYRQEAGRTSSHTWYDGNNTNRNDGNRGRYNDPYRERSRDYRQDRYRPY